MCSLQRFAPCGADCEGRCHAVTIGMALGASLAVEMGWLQPADRDRIIALLPFPTSIGSCDYAQDVFPQLLQAAITSHQQLCSTFPDQGQGTEQGTEMYLRDLGLA